MSSLEKLDSKTLSLGNSGLLSLDGESSSLAVYSKLLNGLEWSKKVNLLKVNGDGQLGVRVMCFR